MLIGLVLLVSLLGSSAAQAPDAAAYARQVRLLDARAVNGGAIRVPQDQPTVQAGIEAAQDNEAKAAETRTGLRERQETASAVFSATVHVMPSAPTLQVGESLTVSVAIRVSEGCQFPIYELTLDQDEPIFAYTSPPTATVGPPVGNPFTYNLTTVATGTTTLRAVVYGERYCNDFWQWHYVYGQSTPVTILQEQHHAYLPILQRP